MSLKSLKSVVRLSRFGEAHYGLRRQRLIVAQTEPVDIGVRLRPIGQIGLGAIADVEEVAEHCHGLALLAFAEQRRHRYAEMLAEQVQQRRLQRGNGMNCHALIESLQSASAGIAFGEIFARGVEDCVVRPDRTANDQFAGVLQGLPDPLAARYLADAGMAGAVAQDHDVTGEERRVRAGKVQQHAVVAGHRDNAHLGDFGRR